MPAQTFSQPTAPVERPQSSPPRSERRLHPGPAAAGATSEAHAHPYRPLDTRDETQTDVCEVACVDHAKVERVRRAAPGAATLATLAETFRALGDPTRLRLVTALAREELCVCDLATLVGVSQSAVSHSLRTLRQLRLVRHRKVGKVAYYQLDDAHVARLVCEGVRHVDGHADVWGEAAP